MDWQLLLVALLVMLALLYLGRQMLRTWRGLGTDCGGCKRPSTAKIPNAATTETFIPIDQVCLRQRSRPPR
jgi:ABC-type uncharacterized transport system YnjBCD permease subunit